MFSKIKYAAAAALAITAIGIGIGVFAGSSGEAQASERDRWASTSNVYKFEDGSAVAGAEATLSRTRDGVTTTLNTDELKAGHAYTMWWVVFNNPKECEFGMPGLTTCGEGDVFGAPFGETKVKVSVQFAAGNIVGGTGMVSLGARLQEYTIPSGHGQLVFGSGLKDSRKAEIHLVVRDHGPVVAGMEELQITSFGAACTLESDPSETGPVGAYTCVDEQFAVFVP